MNRCAPQFLRPLSGMMEVCEGDSVVLDIRVHGRPLPEVEWFHNGQEITQLGTQLENGVHELRIWRVTQENTGEYRCSAANASGRISSALWLAVVPDKRQPVNSARNEPAEKNSGFYFENPLSQSIPVKRDSLPNSQANTPYTLQNRGSRSKSSKENAKVSPRRRAPGFLSRPMPTTIAPGSKLQLKARLLGYPLPKVTWEKDGTALIEDARVQLNSDSNVHQLEIESVNYGDAGTYKVTARNPLGRQHAQAIVNVSKDAPPQVATSSNSSGSNPSSILDVPANQRIWRSSEQPSPSQSQTTEKMTDNYFALSRDFETASSASSRSVQSVQVSLDRLSVNSKSEKSENSIKKIQPFSSPKKLSSRNEPCVIEGLADKQCLLGDYVTLECRISGGNSDPVWRFEGSKELPNGTVARTLGEIYRLRIRGLQLEQFGEYSITVKNDFGSITAKCRIENISEPPQEQPPVAQSTVLIEKSENIMNPVTNRKPLTVLKPLEDITITEGEDVVLTARIVGFPKPDVRFFYEDERFMTSLVHGIKVDQDGDIYRLTLEEASIDDSGEYLVIARSGTAEVDSSCCVVVLQRPPQILDINPEIRVRRGESINIEISSDAEKVTWSYDDQIAEEIEPGRFNFSITQVERGGPITIIGSKGETGSISAKTVLKVIDPPPVAPRFSRELPSEIELELGKSKPLTVEYLGSAKNITWTLNGKPLPHLFDMSSNPNENGGLCQGTFINFFSKTYET